MGLTDIGASVIASALLGDSGYALFDNAHAAIGVGDDSTAFATGQTKLSAETNATSALRKGMNSTFPDRNPDDDGSENKTRYQVTFGTSEANFHWQEWGIFNSATASGGQMLLRVVEDLGTKTSAGQWVFEIDIVVATS